MSMNFNFLRSSSRIGYRFSTKSFLTGLIVEVFGPTWEVWFGCPANKICSYHGLRRDDKRFGGDPWLQSTVLTFPWVNLSLILEAQQQWYQRHGAGRHFEHPVPPRDPDHAVGGFGHATDVAACFDADWETWTTGYPQALLSDFEKEPQYIDIHSWTRVPDRLLDGPLDLDKARLLFWLARGGPRLFYPPTWEVTVHGYESTMALSDPNLACYVLRAFLRLGVFEHWPEFLLDEKLDEARKRYRDYESFNQLTLPVRRLWWVAHQVLQLHYVRSGSRVVPEVFEEY
ncbi:hypothetical protein BT67DRAFT_404432 [Trichocladium antarcticum]|uniref:Uncharacterized protein n=1 Tax=Trichocladium antarcticum TaxID=1450529 RepID=A0AAN6ZD07_9PEZI|nr:hypothetical protein BT67DRAFT_404432 [Trichocladium antarcticum]